MRGAFADHAGRMDTHMQHRPMEAEPRTGTVQAAHPLPVPGGALTLSRLAGRSTAALALVAVALLAGCAGSKGPAALEVNRSVQAVSQSSRISTVIIHYTAANTPRSLDILSTRNVSSHYLITDESPPQVYQLVDENRRAWHAGESEWYGQSGLNASSIGVEIVNQGPQGDGWQAYSEAQIQTLTLLLKDIVARHQIHARNIVGHSDIAPQRKQDPGPAFPWKRLAEEGLGRWHDEALAARLQSRYAAQGLPPMREIQEKLRRAGYSVPDSGVLDAPTRKVLRAFQMHYRPARHDGEADAETLAILDALPR